VQETVVGLTKSTKEQKSRQNENTPESRYNSELSTHSTKTNKNTVRHIPLESLLHLASSHPPPAGTQWRNCTRNSKLAQSRTNTFSPLRARFYNLPTHCSDIISLISLICATHACQALVKRRLTLEISTQSTVQRIFYSDTYSTSNSNYLIYLDSIYLVVYRNMRVCIFTEVFECAEN
jgi:hypothetical protein